MHDKTLKRLTKEKRRGLPQDLIEQLEAEDQVDESELLSRLPPRQLKPGELVGRQSGSLAWRIARGEHSG